MGVNLSGALIYPKWELKIRSYYPITGKAARRILNPLNAMIQYSPDSEADGDREKVLLAEAHEYLQHMDDDFCLEWCKKFEDYREMKESGTQ